MPLTPAERDRLYAIGSAKLDQEWAAAEHWFAEAPPLVAVGFADLLLHASRKAFLRDVAKIPAARDVLCNLAALALRELANRYVRRHLEDLP